MLRHQVANKQLPDKSWKKVWMITLIKINRFGLNSVWRHVLIYNDVKVAITGSLIK